MSNGQPPAGSKAPYIIICSGRIGVADANDKGKKIVAASLCAASFAAFMSANYDVGDDDMLELSAIQHHLMVHQKDMTPKQAETKIAELFDKVTEIEGEYQG